MKPFDSIVVLGPTASGKTKLAVALAGLCHSEIISIDSRMVYKHLDIGSGKDLHEYFYAKQAIPYHLINCCEPQESYHIYQFQQDFKKAFNSIQKKGKLPILCGGSGLYLEAVIQDFTFTSVPTNPGLRQKLEAESLAELQEKFKLLPAHLFKDTADLGSKKRAIRALEIAQYLIDNPGFHLATPAPLNPFIIGLNPNLEERRNNIILRLEHRIHNGLITEVENLLSMGVSKERLLSFGLEYKFVTQFIMGEMSKENMIALLGIAIQQFAKRQMTYFRKMEKSGIQIHWVQNGNEALELVKQQKLL